MPYVACLDVLICLRNLNSLFLGLTRLLDLHYFKGIDVFCIRSVPDKVS